MENVLDQITNYLLAKSWQIAVLAAVITVVSLTLKNKSAHVRYLLWLIVLVKCLVPPLFTISLAILPQGQNPAAAMEIPIITIHLTPIRSDNHPTSSAEMPPSTRPMPGAHDVAARLSPNSREIGRNNTDIP